MPQNKFEIHPVGRLKQNDHLQKQARTDTSRLVLYFLSLKFFKFG